MDKKLWMIAFALLLFAMPLIFAWHIEIGWEIRDDIVFTNGWVVQDVQKIYHLHLYMLIILNFLASVYIISTLFKE